MRSLISLCLSILILGTSLTFGLSPATASTASHTSIIGTLPGLGNAFAGNPPNNIGLQGGHLSPCPDSPNCVLSQNPDELHAIAPIPYTGDEATAQDLLLKVLSVVPRTTVIEQADHYIRVEFQTNLMGFIDDGEFFFSPSEKLIHVRSASRLGESDLNLNRRRIEQIRLAMADLKA